jgi:peptide chain release factor 2
MESTSFWDDPDAAQKVVKECNERKSWIIPFREVEQKIHSLQALYPEAEELGDPVFLQELQKESLLVEKKIEDLEARKMLAGKMDINSAYLSINAGAGGTESCDWVAMLARMYQRWVIRKGWICEIVDKVEGDVVGFKSITLKLEGDFAYGYAKSEKGVHRLVRISPFDSNARRHTSFASVDVTPIVDDNIEINIKPEDLKIDTFRSSGAGGQHVNVTDSAVRMHHLPSGIVVSCQSERSQVQNRETCLKMIRSKLYEREMETREKELKSLGGEKKEIAWGSQIRSYTFQPYTLVKDNRTKCETSNVQAVMDGEIDDFVNAYLKEFG